MSAPTFAVAVSRPCKCGATVLAHGIPKVTGSGKGVYAEHFADHDCIPWYPRSRKLCRLSLLAHRTGERWEQMLYHKRAWLARLPEAVR